MNKRLRSIFYIFVICSLVWLFIILQYPDYECVEYKQSIVSEDPDVIIPTDDKVYFYEDGGVRNVDPNSSDRVPHKKVEGERYISYLRSSGMYSYKIDKNDLTYYYRLGSRGGQCRKIGFIEKYTFTSYQMLEDTEYDY